MSEFLQLESVSPIPEDELLLVRNRTGKRTTVAALKSAVGIEEGAVAFSQIPPDKGDLWLQTGKNELPVELWQRHSSGKWLSLQSETVDYFRGSTSGNFSRYFSNPCHSKEVWIEAMSIKSLVISDQKPGERFDIQFRLLTSKRQQIPMFFLRIEKASKDDYIQLSERVDEFIDAEEAMAIGFRGERRGGSARLQYTAMNAVIKRVYHAENYTTG